MRADGHARADLARSLGYADEHDVHDSDAADDQRNAGDRAEQSGHDVGRRRGRIGDFLLIRTVKSSSRPARMLCRWRNRHAAWAFARSPSACVTVA